MVWHQEYSERNGSCDRGLSATRPLSTRSAVALTLVGRHVLIGLALAIPLVMAGLSLGSARAFAGDWPQWRYDAGHTAAGAESLPETLEPLWTRTYSARRQVWDDPLNHDLMPYDRVFEPVVMGGRMFVGFNDADKVVALDTKTGELLWTFYTEGPVRLPAVAWGDNVYFASDDGHLYCVASDSGALRWKFQGAPSARKALGNLRMISAWPARGGPVIADGRVYFAASIWPFMGTYLYCLDAESGQVIWLNDSNASQYVKQPHSAPSFAGVAPQGTMVVCDDYLIVPGGRSVPAAFDRETGELRHFLLNEGGKGNGGSLVLARDREFYVHTRVRGVRAFELESGNKTAFMTNDTDLIGSEETVNVYNDLGVNFRLTNALSTRVYLQTDWTDSPAPGFEEFDNSIGLALVASF